MAKLIKNEADLADLIAQKDGVFLMVYASWCHFSQHFLPIFENFAANKTHNCARVMVDDLDNIADRFDIDVYPAVLYFKNGKLVKRLDSVAGIGLDEPKLKEFISHCASAGSK